MSLRYCWNQLGKGMLYSEFYAISYLLHAISRNFHIILAISAIFWINFNMLGIKNEYIWAEKLIVLGDVLYNHYLKAMCTKGCIMQFKIWSWIGDWIWLDCVLVSYFGVGLSMSSLLRFMFTVINSNTKAGIRLEVFQCERNNGETSSTQLGWV